MALNEIPVNLMIEGYCNVHTYNMKMGLFHFVTRLLVLSRKLRTSH
jgi:hypothetical protein